MSNDKIRRNMAVFSMSVVCKLTELTQDKSATMKHMNLSCPSVQKEISDYSR